MAAELAILEFIKLAPRFIFALGISAGALLFARDHILKRISLAEFVQKYRFGLGLILILSAPLVVDTALPVFGSIKTGGAKRRFHRDVIKRLHHLTEDEADSALLRYE